MVIFKLSQVIQMSWNKPSAYGSLRLRKWYPSGPMCACDGIPVAQCVYAMVSQWPNVCM